MNAAIISIGDEILIGQVVNTNASFIAQKVSPIGIEISKIIVTGDTEDKILNVLQSEYSKHEILFITGGLGPTHDDVTRSAICKFFQTSLVPSEEARKYVLEFLNQRNRSWSEAAENQTYIPDGAIVMPNKSGTAPGEFFNKDGKYVIVMPGVPYEMESMITDFVIPYFRKLSQKNFILHRTLMTTGIPESELAQRLGDLSKLLQGAKLAFLPSPTGVRLRITVTGNDSDYCTAQIQKIESDIREKAEKYIYGIDEELLEEALGKLLLQHNLKIAIAESCTGGLIVNKMTNVPGSSNYLERAVVTYSNKSKIDLLNVPKELFTTVGAVSKEVAEAMALGIREMSGTDIGVSTTGIAGPAGGTSEKPIGLVWIGYSDKDSTFGMKFNFGDGRIRIKERASQAAMDLVRRKILKIQ
ncbi:MAG: competence/damage-inducible protein A [Ignavibacteriales bacterium]|nr:competence/damage-inducible protein A [Ignavibacteriales bacterium]